MNDKYQSFLDKLQIADESERDWLVMEFSLQNLSEVFRQAVWAAAIPHWFDHAYLNAVLGFTLKDEDFNALIELSFIEAFPEHGFNVHERSRNLLLDYLWKNNKSRYQKLSKQAAAFCKKQDQSIAAWRIETLYHGLLANNPTAKQRFIEQALDWANSFQYDNLENLTQVILAAVKTGQLTKEIEAWTAFFQAKLDVLYNRYSSAQEFLRQSLKQKINKLLTAHSIFLFGDVHYALAEFSQAQACYQQALLIYQLKSNTGEANCIRALGDLHRALAEYGQAQRSYQQALPIYQKIKEPLGEANCFYSLGEVHYALAEYDQARGRYQQALPIYQKIKEPLGEANCIQSLGRLEGAKQQITLAINTLYQAAQLFDTFGNKRSQADCFNELANIYQRQKEFSEALAAFNRAIAIFPNEGVWYLGRASLYMDIENYSAAKTDIKQAETLCKNLVGPLLCKAEFALWQQQSPQAVNLSQQALSQRPADGNAHAIYALTLLADGQVQLAYTEMVRALSTVHHRHHFDNILDILNKLTKIYGNSAEANTLRELILNRYPK
jgi:tetratricopeptide (TPR) repeat protein